MSKSVTIRAVPVEVLAQVIRLGDEQIAVEIEPKTRYAVTVDSGEKLEVAALFDGPDAARQAAEELTQLMKHMDGPQLATVNGRVLQ